MRCFFFTAKNNHSIHTSFSHLIRKSCRFDRLRHHPHILSLARDRINGPPDNWINKSTVSGAHSSGIIDGARQARPLPKEIGLPPRQVRNASRCCIFCSQSTTVNCKSHSIIIMTTTLFTISNEDEALANRSLNGPTIDWRATSSLDWFGGLTWLYFKFLTCNDSIKLNVLFVFCWVKLVQRCH